MTTILCLLILGAAPPAAVLDTAGEPLPGGAAGGIANPGAKTVQSVAFRPGGRVMATGSADGVRFWHLPTRRVHRHIKAPPGLDSARVLIDGKGELAVWLPREGAAHAYDIRAARPLPILEMSGRLVEAAISFDGSTAARVESLGGSLTVVVWRVRTGRERTRFAVPGTPDLKCHLALSPDGERLAIVLGSGKETAYAGIVRLGSHTQSGDIDTARPVVGLTYSPDGETLAVQGEGGVALVSGRSGRGRADIRLPGLSADRVAFSPDGRALAVANADYPKTKMALVDLATGKVRESREVSLPQLEALAFTPDGGTLAGGHRSGKAVVWDVSGRAALRVGVAAPDLVEQMMSPDIGPAFAAMGTLIRARDRAVPLLRARLRPSKGPPSDEEITAWIALTRDDDKVLRARATDALIAAGPLALPALREVMARGELRPGLEKVIDGIANPPGRRALGNRQPIQTHIGEQSGPTTVQRFIPSGRTTRP